MPGKQSHGRRLPLIPNQFFRRWIFTKCTAGSRGNAGLGARHVVNLRRRITRSPVETVAETQLTVQVEATDNHEENARSVVKQGRSVHSTAENSDAQMEDCSEAENRESGGHVRRIRSVSQPVALRREGESVTASSARQVEERGVPHEVKVEEAEDLQPHLNEADEESSIAVPEYVADIYAFYRQTEGETLVPPDYLDDQPEITECMRAQMINWLAEVQSLMDLLQETLFLAVNLADRYLSKEKVKTAELALVAVTAMLLACKHEEVAVPTYHIFLRYLHPNHTKDDFFEMERKMMPVLQYKFTLPTPYLFLTKFLDAAESNIDLEMVSCFLAELCLLEYDMLRYLPSMLAAAAVYTGRCVLEIFPAWNDTLERQTTYTEDQLRECANLMVGLHLNAEENKHNAVYKKYSTSKFRRAARHQPALWLL